MPRALPFLFLLLLGCSPLCAVPPGLGDNAGVLLPEHGSLCQALRPDALPGFSRLPPSPRTLARAALALALSRAACAPQAEEEVLRLTRELGTPAATALLRGLAQLRDAPAPKALSLLLLLSLGRPGGSAPEWPCLAPTQPQSPVAGTHPTPPGVPAAGGRVLPAARAHPWLPACRRATRHRREDEDACNPPGERKAHGVLEWVPGVSTFYNLGTSIYYAFQGCEALASTRALEVAEDLGYAGLAALAAAAGGPVALGLQLGLQPGLKAGVRALITYFTSDGDPPPAPTTHSGPVLIV
ncbi:apolipoprotein F [Tyto alba]|uniref:apolipoprotein F n=1 Tax=Tyto alba TaxID=56313 RepID=UPI001C671244|nr:apolipoprotein F [Tyto alba]